MMESKPGACFFEIVSVETAQKKRKGYLERWTTLGLPVLVICIFSLIGCAKPVPLAFNGVCQIENNNKYISVEGYLRTGASVLCSSREGTSTCGLELLEKLEGENKISVYLEEGTGNSQMEPLPKSYSRDDLKIHTRDGQTLGPQDRVRIVGNARIGGDTNNPSYTICYIDVNKIEKP